MAPRPVDVRATARRAPPARRGGAEWAVRLSTPTAAFVV